MNDTALIEFIEREATDPSGSFTSWVSPKHNYLFLGVGKTASTRIKLSLHILEGYQVLERPFPWLHARSRPDGSYVPKLSDFSTEKLVEILTSPKWFRFCFVRNPYHRLFSAYKSNIMLEMEPPSPFYNRIKEQIRTTRDYPVGAGERAGTVAFRDFVRYVQDTIDKIPDYHWCTLRWGLRPDLINYDFVGHVENFEHDFKRVLLRLGVDADVHASLLEPVNQSGLQRIPLAAVYDWKLADQVYDMYKKDFDTYGYDKTSWLFDEV